MLELYLNIGSEGVNCPINFGLKDYRPSDGIQEFSLFPTLDMRDQETYY